MSIISFFKNTVFPKIWFQLSLLVFLLILTWSVPVFAFDLKIATAAPDGSKFYFRNGHEEKYYIGSADAMRRNLEHRVEVLVPVEDQVSRKVIREMLDTQWQDNRSAWELQSDGSYEQRRAAAGEKEIVCQHSLIDLAERRVREHTRLRKRKTKSIAGRNQLLPVKD